MTSNIPHASATIIPFPTNRRTALARREENLAAEQPVSEVACGSWYHEAAIQESKWVQKH